MTIQVSVPDELVTRIDNLTSDRASFVLDAIRTSLRESEATADTDEIARINSAAEDLNREAEDVLEYQAIP